MSRRVDKKMSQDDVRMMNYLLVLKLLREQGPASMADLVAETKLTFPSVSSIVMELENYGVVEKAGLVQTKRGRLPKLYKFKGNTHHVLGLCFGSDSLSVGLGDLDGHVSQVLSEPLPENKGVDNVLDMSIELVRRFMSQVSIANQNILGVGVSMHGVVDPQNGVSVYPSHLKWSQFPMAERLGSHLGIPILMENDINCLLLAEKWFGQGRNLDSFALVNVNHGIGAGAMTNGAILHGTNFGAGQIGHILMIENGLECDCGKYGCLETVASEKAILRYVAERMRYGEPTQMTTGTDSLGGVSLEQIYEAAQDGDNVARDALSVTGRNLGKAMSILVNILNPKRIILTGGITRGVNLMFPIIQETVTKHALSTNIEGLEIKISDLGPYSDVMGAITLWIDALFTGKFPFSSLIAVE